MSANTLDGQTVAEPTWYLYSDQDTAQDSAIPYFRGFMRNQIGMSATALDIGRAKIQSFQRKTERQILAIHLNEKFYA